MVIEVKEKLKFKSNKCDSMTVIKYYNSRKVLVRFEDGTEILSNSHCIRKGAVVNPNYPGIYGHGYTGIGKYKKAKHLRLYSMWLCVLRSAYDENSKGYNKHITIDSTWHNFQTFCIDTENMYGYSKLEQYHSQLDRTFFKKGNNLYSKETCFLVPRDIAFILRDSYSVRGPYPIGVKPIFDSNISFFSARISKNNKKHHLGSFATIEDAFYAYKCAKELHIQDKMKEYREVLDPKCYEIMMNYSVEIDD